MQAQGRHISLETLDDYVRAGVQASIPIPGDPVAILTIDVPNDELLLEVSWDGEEPPAVGEYLHISTGTRFRGGTNWSTVAIHGARFFSEAYPLLRNIVDQVQLEAVSFADSIRSSLAHYHDLLSALGQMPLHAEIGLFGELLVVSHLIASMGPSAALEAWRGGDQPEEHDLGLPDADVEIKTTTSETRRHWINGIDQLTPTPSRELWLMSIQLTAAGAEVGERLPDLIHRVESQLPHPVAVEFGNRIARTKFKPKQPRETFRRLRLRAKPAGFIVGDDFPRLDTQMLTNAGASVARLEELSYVIRLDGLKPAPSLPFPLRGLLEAGT